MQHSQPTTAGLAVVSFGGDAKSSTSTSVAGCTSPGRPQHEEPKSARDARPSFGAVSPPFSTPASRQQSMLPSPHVPEVSKPASIPAAEPYYSLVNKVSKDEMV